MDDKRKGIKLGFILIFVTSFIYLALKLNIFEKESITKMLIFGRKTGKFGIFFILLSGILMVFFVPLSWFSPIAALCFGLKGWIYVTLAAHIAAVSSFFMARMFKDDITKAIIKIYNRKKRKITLDQLSYQIEKYGVSYIFFLRSMPFIPYTLASYVSGLTSVKIKDYILGTFLGLTPNQIINSFFYVNAINIAKDPGKAIIAGLTKGFYALAIFCWQRKSKYNIKD